MRAFVTDQLCGRLLQRCQLSHRVKFYSTSAPIGSSSSSPRTVGLKKLVFPLVKKIHPDAWTAESDDIQAANLKCLQLVNQLTNRLESIERSVATDAQIPVADPFDAKYELDFYMRGEEEGSVPERIKMQLHIPAEFCERQLLTKRTAVSCLSVVYRGVANILRRSGIKHISPDAMGTLDEETKNKKAQEKREHIASDITEETLKEFEFDKKALKRISEMQRAGVASPELLFHMDAERRVDEDSAFLRASIKAYIVRGNVLTRGLDGQDELAAVLRLQHFLEKFALTINFSIETWGHINFVLVSRGMKYKFKEINDDVFIVAPANFKSSALLEFIRTQVKLNANAVAYMGSDAAADLNEDI